MRLYVVRGVSEDTEFVTRTKKEIGEIAWHKIKDLPTSKEDAQVGRAPLNAAANARGRRARAESGSLSRPTLAAAPTFGVRPPLVPRLRVCAGQAEA
eukprot:1586566-Prymnesium_polylepis.1